MWLGKASIQSLNVRQAVFIETCHLPKIFNTIFDSQGACGKSIWFYYLDPRKFIEYAVTVFEMLIRLDSYSLGDGWIRVALPAMDEIDAWIKALIRYLKSAGGREISMKH